MIRTLSLAAVVLSAGLVVAAGLESGPQVGQSPKPFAPLNVNGETPDQKVCLVCRNGSNPVAMVFARCADCPMTQKLIKAIDKATVENKKAEMGSFVVFCSDEEGLDKKLKDMVKTADIKECVLSIDTPTGPSGYKIAKDADLTVVIYTNRKVTANYAFKKGELKDSDIETVLKDIGKITAK
jgi:hypothetical protein